MKIEMDDATALTVIVTVVSVCVLIGGVRGCQMSEDSDREKVKAGLVEKIDGPSNRKIWVKPEEKKP